MRKRSAAAAIVAALLACVPRGPTAPLVQCPAIRFDPRVPPDVSRAAEAAGVRVVPCTNGEYGLVLPGARERSLEDTAAWKQRVAGAIVHRPMACTDEYAGTLRDAYCGCVDGACRWFELDR